MYRISGTAQARYEREKYLAMGARSHSWHVFHDEVSWPKRFNNTREVKNQVISLIEHIALADRGEPLTWWAAEDRINLSVPPCHITPVLAQPLTNRSRQGLAVDGFFIAHVGTYYRRIRTIILVNRSVNGIILNRCNDIKASLFEPQGKAADAREQINGDRSRRPHRLSTAQLFCLSFHPFGSGSIVQGPMIPGMRRQIEAKWIATNHALTALSWLP